MSARMVLVRHGETVNHRENRYTGRSDVALTERGVLQSELLGAWAATAGLDGVVTSPLSRCRITAAPSVESTGLEAVVEPRLRELDFGALDGLTRDEAAELYPEQTAAFLADPAANYFPGGEPPVDAVARANLALDDLAGRHQGGRILVVAHSTLIRLVLCDRIGIPLREYRTVFPELGNCALTEIRTSEHGATGLLSYNVPLADLASAHGKGEAA